MSRPIGIRKACAATAVYVNSAQRVPPRPGIEGSAQNLSTSLAPMFAEKSSRSACWVAPCHRDCLSNQVWGNLVRLGFSRTIEGRSAMLDKYVISTLSSPNRYIGKRSLRSERERGASLRVNPDSSAAYGFGSVEPSARETRRLRLLRRGAPLATLLRRSSLLGAPVARRRFLACRTS